MESTVASNKQDEARQTGRHEEHRREGGGAGRASGACAAGRVETAQEYQWGWQMNRTGRVGAKVKAKQGGHGEGRQRWQGGQTKQSRGKAWRQHGTREENAKRAEVIIIQQM